MAGGNVKHANNEKEMAALLAAAGGYLVVIDFTATWCGPCQRVAPLFAEWSEKYSDVVFIKVDVDVATDVSESYGVNCMPTFVFLKNGKKIHTIEGADVNAILRQIETSK